MLLPMRRMNQRRRLLRLLRQKMQPRAPHCTTAGFLTGAVAPEKTVGRAALAISLNELLILLQQPVKKVTVHCTQPETRVLTCLFQALGGNGAEALATADIKHRFHFKSVERYA